MFEIFNRHIYRLAVQRHRELLCQAGSCRLVRQGLPDGLESQRLYSRALAWLGRRLVAWGWRLQGRYGAMPTH
jgi:hypothetical protein